MSTPPQPEPIFDDGVLPVEPSTPATEPIVDTPIAPAETLTPPPARMQRSRAWPVFLSLVAGTVGGALISNYHSQDEIKKLSDIVYSQTEIPAQLRSDLEIGNHDKKEPSNTLQDLVVDWHEAKNLRQLSSLTIQPSQKGAKVSYNGCKDLKEDADSVRELLGRYSSLPGDELNEPTLRTLGNRTIVSMTRLLDGCAANIANTPDGTELAKIQKELEEVRAEIVELGKTCTSDQQTTAASTNGTNQTPNSELAATNYVTAPCVDTACLPVPVCPSTPTLSQTTCPVIDVKTTQPYLALQKENELLIGSAQKLNSVIVGLEQDKTDLKKLNKSLEQTLGQAQSANTQTSVSDCPEYIAVDCETEPLSNGAELGIATYGTAVKQALECKNELEQTRSLLEQPAQVIPVDAPADAEDLDSTLVNGTADACPEPIVCPEAPVCQECPTFDLERECSTYRPADTNKDSTINGDDLTCKELADEYLKPKTEGAAASARTRTKPARAEARASTASYDCTSQGGHRYNNLTQMCGEVERLVEELTTCEHAPTSQTRAAQPSDNCDVNCQTQANERYLKLKADIRANNTDGVMKSVEDVVCSLGDKAVETKTLGGIYDLMFVDLKDVPAQEFQGTRQGFIAYVHNANPQLREQASRIDGDVDYTFTCR